MVTLEQCTEQSVPPHPCISAEQATLQHNGDMHCLSMVVPNENMTIDEQCDLQMEFVIVRNWVKCH